MSKVIKANSHPSQKIISKSSSNFTPIGSGKWLNLLKGKLGNLD